MAHLRGSGAKPCWPGSFGTTWKAIPWLAASARNPGLVAAVNPARGARRHGVGEPGGDVLAAVGVLDRGGRDDDGEQQPEGCRWRCAACGLSCASRRHSLAPIRGRSMPGGRPLGTPRRQGRLDQRPAGIGQVSGVRPPQRHATDRYHVITGNCGISKVKTSPPQGRQVLPGIRRPLRPGKENTRGRGIPPTRRDSRAARHDPAPKSSTSQSLRPPHQRRERSRLATDGPVSCKS